MSWLILYTIGGWLVRAAMVPVVLGRRFAPGAAWAWLGIVFLHPYIGFTLYMLVGETRIDPRRAELHRQIIEQFRRRGGVSIPPPQLAEIYHPMAQEAEKISGLPIRDGNAIEFLADSNDMVNQLCAAIDAGRSQVHLLYYIYACDKTGEKVTAALMRAAMRGVKCRVLVDAVGSRSFFGSDGPAARLQAAQVEVAAAQRVATLRRGFSRMDLRNHRKLAIIDGQVALAGSQNLVNADYDGKCGQWFDVTGKLTGPIVAELDGVFCEDWALETGQKLQRLEEPPPVAENGIPMQAVPTGPSFPGETYRRVLLAAIQSARRQLILTTPYFVPDEPTLVSLMMAADQGVEVKLILPMHPDHMFTAAAGRAHFETLMHAGVKIFLFEPGILHSKTTTVDDAFVLYGSANLDVRSFNLNYELSLLLYGSEVTNRMRAIQLRYLEQSKELKLEEWLRRSTIKRYADGAISMLSPLL